MPSETQLLADYAYDTASDIVRIWTAMGTILLPLCFFWHARKRDKSVPAFIGELQSESWLVACSIFQRRWWHILVFLVFFWLQRYYLWTVPQIANSELWQEVACEDRLLYPVLSFSFLWCLKDELRTEKCRSMVYSTPSFVLTFIWTLVAMLCSKGSAQFFGFFSMFYVLLAVRADLTLALIFTRSMNPISAMWKSLLYSQGRAKQFAWTFSLLAGTAWALIFLSRIFLSGLEQFFEHLQFQLNPLWHFVIESVFSVPVYIILAFVDCLYLARGVRFLQHIESQSNDEGEAAAAFRPVSP